MERRFKTLKITEELLQSSPGMVREIFDSAVPIDIKHDVPTGTYTYTLYSPNFAIVPEGDYPPDALRMFVEIK